MPAPAPTPHARRLKVALLTPAGLDVEWELAATDGLSDAAAAGFRALLYRQEVQDADIVLVAYAAVRHGSADVQALIAEACIANAPKWRRLCLAACDRSEQQVTKDDVTALVTGTMLCSTGRFIHPSELREKLSEWIQATGLQLGVAANEAGLELSTDDDADTDSIDQKGEPWNSDWF